MMTITDRLAGSLEDKAIGSVRPSVRPFVSTLSFEPTDLWTWGFVPVWVMTIARLGLKVKVKTRLV